MKAILVDDEPDGIRTLEKLLELNCPEVEIAGNLCQCYSLPDKNWKNSNRTWYFWISGCRVRAVWIC